MLTNIHNGRGILRTLGIPFLLGAVGLGFWASPAQALLVEVNIGWGYNQDAAGNDLLAYNLQVGSIVQIIMYDSSVGSPPGVDASDNFDIIGNYDGTDIAEPYDTEAVPGEHTPTDSTVYDPSTHPADHLIVYTATVQAAPYLDDNDNVWWQVFAQFTVLGNYDSLYVRVFGMTVFPDGTPGASYWGLSDVQTSTNTIGTWFVPVGSLDDIVASNKNYFMVIPEPGTFALFILGGAGLFAGRWRRRKSASAS